MNPNYYDILGLTNEATPQEIRTAHRTLARRYHPDTAENGRGDPELLTQVQEAYEVLSVPDFRRRYDTKLAGLRSEAAGRAPRRPPKSPCAVCQTPVYASQLKLYLGRFMCKRCFDRKRERDANRIQVGGFQEVRWQLKRFSIWMQSHVALIAVAIIALGAGGARVAWTSHKARHPYRDQPPATSMSRITTPGALPPESTVPVAASETADVRAVDGPQKP